MVVSNEDKIALLEFLEYKYLGWGRYRHQIYGTTTDERFNPLNISILTKALDIIEKKYSTMLSIDLNDKEEPYRQFIFDQEYNAWIGQEGNTREEAILKAVLEYIKTTKK